MTIDTVIDINNISKLYYIYNNPQDRLKQMLWQGRKEIGREFWALKNISTNIKKGEWVGIIGKNGSGKSTLLQIIAGTLTPTQGEVHVHGRVAALLELGSGFNPEFTGRENIFLNGAILGLSRKQMELKLESIIDFADIGEFIDQPVKLYSSGMFVRLAFAVTTSLDPDILIIDEALAVGDIFFRQKCYRRLSELAEKGTSILLVSHSMMDIEQFCQRAIVLSKGNIIFQGDASEAVKRYMLLDQKDKAEAITLPSELHDISQFTESDNFWPTSNSFFDLTNIVQVTNNWARCTGIAICDKDGNACRVFMQGELARFFYEFEVLHDIEVPIGGIVIHNDKGLLVHGKSTLEYGSDAPAYVPTGTILRFAQSIQLDLAMGEYSIEPGLATIPLSTYKDKEQFQYAELDSKIVRICHLPIGGYFTVVYPRGHQPIQLLHHGIANLPGECDIALLLPNLK